MLDASPKSSEEKLPAINLTRIDSLSYDAPDIRGYILLGDNVKTLRSIEPSISGRVKCVYIDPPYNNLEDFRDYQDTDSHEEWLTKVSNHVLELYNTLSQDGSIWISIDDRQVHYLKVSLDRLLGRSNFLTTVIWEHRRSRENRKVFSNNHEYILVYAKNPAAFRKARNLLPLDETVLSRYKNPDCDPRGPWQSVSLNVQAGHATAAQFYAFQAPSGVVHYPPNGRCWSYSKQRLLAAIEDGRVWFGPDGKSVPRLKMFLSESRNGLTPHTLWSAQEVGTTEISKREFLANFPNEEVFDTPKPEGLVRRIIEIASNPGDLILDSYLGSGTTAAVALKSGRLFVGIEQSKRASALSSVRLKNWLKSHAVNGHGGMGFVYGKASCRP